MSSPFDDFAWFYDKHWAAGFAEWQLPAIERLLMARVDAGAHLLDLCCGTGALARKLLDRGFVVTGVDGSAGMLDIARNNAPEAILIHSDASRLALDQPMQSALCVFDSLNNIFEPEALQQAFGCVRSCLVPGGFFLFDVNTSAAYGEQWDRTYSEVRPDHAFFLRGGFNPHSRIGHTDVTMFRLIDGWQRSDVQIQQRPWDVEEVEPLLRNAGVMEIEYWRAIEDLEMPGHYGIGRTYFRARKP